MVVSPSALDPDPIDVLCPGNRRRAAVAKVLKRVDLASRADAAYVEVAAQVLQAVDEDVADREAVALAAAKAIAETAVGTVTELEALPAGPTPEQQIRALALDSACRFYAGDARYRDDVVSFGQRLAHIIETGEW